MKRHERRSAGKPAAYFKLATWDARQLCWSDGSKQFDSESEARAAAKKPGRYRISRVEETRVDLEPFEI